MPLYYNEVQLGKNNNQHSLNDLKTPMSLVNDHVLAKTELITI